MCEGGRDSSGMRLTEGRGSEQGSDSGPVINEESNFQAGDLTSSRPTVAATQCEMERAKVVVGEKGEEAIGMRILQVDAQTSGGTAKEG